MSRFRVTVLYLLHSRMVMGLGKKQKDHQVHGFDMVLVEFALEEFFFFTRRKQSQKIVNQRDVLSLTAHNTPQLHS